MKTAIITGASAGIGREFALLADKSALYDEIWLIARRTARLETVAAAMQTKTKILPLDLTNPESFERYRQALHQAQAHVALLVNSAGAGKIGDFIRQTEREVNDMIRLNVTATVMLCRDTLPYMQRNGKIINMASASGSLPLPGLNVYAATKAFVKNFTVALCHELKPLGVTATAVCPYWMNTEFISNARDTAAPETVRRFLFLYEPAPIAAQAMRDAFAGHAESVCGAAAKLCVNAAALLPSRVCVKVWQRMQKRRRDRQLAAQVAF